jgi:hypothetical protein
MRQRRRVGAVVGVEPAHHQQYWVLLVLMNLMVVLPLVLVLVPRSAVHL